MKIMKTTTRSLPAKVVATTKTSIETCPRQKLIALCLDAFKSPIIPNCFMYIFWISLIVSRDFLIYRRMDINWYKSSSSGNTLWVNFWLLLYSEYVNIYIHISILMIHYLDLTISAILLTSAQELLKLYQENNSSWKSMDRWLDIINLL